MTLLEQGGAERGGVSYLVTVFKGSGTQMTRVCGKHYLRPISRGQIRRKHMTGNNLEKVGDLSA